jgi:hypothetical protein
VKAMLLLLLAANVAFAAYAYWSSTMGQPEAALVAQQIEPEKIKLLTRDEAASMGAAARKKLLACLEWGAFSPAEVTKANEALGALAAGVDKRERRIDESARWWVMIPSLANRTAATNRVNELKKQGVEEMFVIDDDAYRNAVSLGLFRNEEGARARLDALEKRGVKDARVVARDAGTRVYLQLREVPDTVRARLTDLKASFPAVEVRDCAP